MIRFLIKQQFAFAEKCFDSEGEIKKPFERYFASFINQVLKGQKIRYLIEVHEESNVVSLTFKMNANAKSMHAARNLIARYEK